MFLRSGGPSRFMELSRFSRREFLRHIGKLGKVIPASFLLPGLSWAADALQKRPGSPATRPSQKVLSPPAGFSFTDIAAEAGLSGAVNVFGGVERKRYLLEEIGCGVALFDYDNDGWLDIFFVNGTSLEPFQEGQHPTSYLFHNNRDGTFTDVTQKARLTHSGWGQGCCVGDYDNDGYDDLFVSYWGHHVLYHNNGDGTFTDVSEKAGVAGTGNSWGAGCCFLDYDRDGHLDLFIANYVNFDPARAPKPGASAYCSYNDIPVPCGPLGYAGGTNILYRNRGNGTFVDVSEESGIANPRGTSTMVFVGSNWQ